MIRDSPTPLDLHPKHATAQLVAPATVVLALAASALLLGQTQTQTPALPAMNKNVVVLDPAHGGPDAGAKLGDQLLEKDVTLALAARLRAALAAAGFTVVSTREADSFNPLTNDQRAEIANRAHPLACIVIHATGTGSGVHLYASALDPKDPATAAGADDRPEFEPTPWETAQAESVRQSLRLEGDLSAALGAANLPVISGRASVRPLDSLMCPAVAVEVAPLAVAGGGTAPIPIPMTDPGYQQRLADALARSLQIWRSHADPPASHVPAAAGATASAGGSDAKHGGIE